MTAETRGGASVRRGEFTPFAGVRARTRAVPCPGRQLSGADPWNGEYRRSGRPARGRPGPADPAPWIDALRSSPPGIVLVGPSGPGEGESSAALAAVGALRALARGGVLVDVELSGPLPEAGKDLVFISVWRSGVEAELWELLRRTARSFTAGVALPLLPGWTADEEFLAAFVSRARNEGASFAVPLEVAESGVSRAAIHADFAAVHPERADSYFEFLHHGDWDARLASARERFRPITESAGMAARAPRPVGRGDFATNARVIEELESRAELSEEPLAARLRAASRRVEELGRDLAGLAAEGNLRLLFPAGTPERAVLDRVLEPSGALRA